MEDFWDLVYEQLKDYPTKNADQARVSWLIIYQEIDNRLRRLSTLKEGSRTWQVTLQEIYYLIASDPFTGLLPLLCDYDEPTIRAMARVVSTDIGGTFFSDQETDVINEALDDLSSKCPEIDERIRVRLSEKEDLKAAAWLWEKAAITYPPLAKQADETSVSLLIN